MTPLQEAVWKLRLLCKENGIFTLSSLDCYVHAGDGVTQEGIAKNSHQTQSAVGTWVNLAEAHGLLEMGTTPGRKRRPITYTPDGKNLLDQLAALLCPPEPTTSSPAP